MGRAYTRNELLVEVAAAATKLHEVGGMGDLRRYTDDEVFRFGLAYCWLRVAEPACQLVTRRLVGDGANEVWGGMCTIRNALAHEREEDINYRPLWFNLPSSASASLAHAERLLAAD